MYHKGMSVKDVTRTNQAVDGVFRVSSVSRQNKSNGEPYWSFSLNDATGSVVAKRWPQGGSLTPAELPEDCYAHIYGVGSPFREQMQVRVDQIQILTADEVAQLDMTYFLPQSPYDGPASMAELLAVVERETAGTVWQKLVRTFFDVEENKKAFASASAARAVHHSGRGGLAVHTLEVCKTALACASIYQDVDRAALATAALFHDIGKLREMETGLFETAYTPAGKIIGHLVLGVTMIQPCCEQVGLPEPLRDHLFHCILSHHGSIEHGAVKLPATREAILLAQADMLSAKMNTIAQALQDVPEGEVSPKNIFGIEGPVYHRVSTDNAGDEARKQTGTTVQSAEQTEAPVTQAVSAGKGASPRKAYPRAANQTAPAAEPAIASAPAPFSADAPPWDEEGYLDALANAEPPVPEEDASMPPRRPARRAQPRAQGQRRPAREARESEPANRRPGSLFDL